MADAAEDGSDDGTEYASSDDGAFPFADEAHVDHFGTFSSEGDSFAPLIETPLTAVRRMLEIARLQPTEKLVDIGCGDGRIVVDAAEHFGCIGVGIDLFDDRLGNAVAWATEHGMADHTSFLQADAHEFDFSSFDVVCVFLLPEALAIMLPKLKESLAWGARVASYWFPVQGLSDADDVHLTTDPTGQIRVFVYSAQPLGGGGVREPAAAPVAHSHTVSGDRA